METPEQPEAEENSVCEPLPSTFQHTVSRDEINERTGEVMREAFHVAESLGRPVVILVEDPRDGTRAPVILDRTGANLLSPDTFERYRDLPLHRKGQSELKTLDSYIDLTNRFRDGASAIFACDDMAAPGLTTVFDYHPSNTAPDHHPEARAMRHTAHYAFPLSDEWKAWMALNASPMSMSDFAAFLEDRIVDVTEDKPSSLAARDFVSKTGGNFASPSKLIEIARGLQVNEASVLREARNLSSGEAEIVFNSEHLDATGQKLVLPNLFVICVPVFAKSTVFYQIVARLRYRKAGGGLTFWYELWRPELVFEQAFTDDCVTAKEQTELPLYVGAPER